MTKGKKKINKKFNLVSKIISSILALSVTVATSFIIYFEILPLTFLSLLIILGGFILILLIRLANSKLKNAIRSVLMGIEIIITIIAIFVSFYSLSTVNMFNDIFDTGIRVDNYSVYVLKDSNYKDINELKNKNIGMLEYERKLLETKLNKNKYNLKEYDISIDMFTDLNKGTLDAIVLLNTNMDLLKEENKDYENYIPIYSFDVTTKVDTIDKDVDIAKESFIIYISGIDTNGKVSSKARSDVNILVAVNPTEKRILILNTPRDYYVELSNGKFDKLTHAGVLGIEESIKALENLYDTSINYYVRVNFTTFMKIVDALDGIKVNVPKSFCEQTSNRESEEQICLKKGKQNLNGEQALALARSRHAFLGGDRDRGKNQMLILEALIDKALSPKIITKYTSLISKVSKSVVTNIDEKDITKLIKNQIEENSGWTIETLSVDGTDSYDSIFSAGNLKAYVMKPDQNTVNTAKERLKGLLK